jgi:FixJ family two-component response regulator
MRDATAVVVVVDDDQAILRAVSRMLDTERLRVFTFSSAQEFLDEGAMPHPDCLLLDIRMPDFDGLDLIRVVRATGGETPAVFMTATGRVATVVEAMKEGAEDLLVKPFTAAELVRAIDHALESGGATRAKRRTLAGAWRLLHRLTPREAEVCALVACGLLNKRVAAVIGTTEKTVKVHRGRVMHKLGVSSVAELVRLVDMVLGDAACTMVNLGDVTLDRPDEANILIDVITRRRATAEQGARGELSSVD